jgi:hypothetical protein
VRLLAHYWKRVCLLVVVLVEHKIKEKIWKGEFIDLNLFLKSAKDLVNEPSLC